MSVERLDGGLQITSNMARMKWDGRILSIPLMLRLVHVGCASPCLMGKRLSKGPELMVDTPESVETNAAGFLDRRDYSAGLAHWRACYGDLWKAKIAFEEKCNRRVEQSGSSSKMIRAAVSLPSLQVASAITPGASWLNCSGKPA